MTAPMGRTAVRVAAGWPFFGQFIAHDITADRSPLGHRADPEQVRNFRTPRANLEGVYGAGPIGSPYLLRQGRPGEAPAGRGWPRRAAQSRGDRPGRRPAQRHPPVREPDAGRLHQDPQPDRRPAPRRTGWTEADVFEEARRADHLALPVGDPARVPAAAGRRGADAASCSTAARPLFGPSDDPYIPFEFADAAYRYGHSQVRDTYRVNRDFGPVPGLPRPDGLRRRAGGHAIDWTPAVRRSRPRARAALQEDRRQAAPLADRRCRARSPARTRARPTRRSPTATSSAARRSGCASGEAVARELGVEPLSPEQIGLAERGWEQETPLWLYVLKEAEALEDGDRLGPVGGRIVGEVLVGIIDADPESFRSVDPSWRPTLPSHEAGIFGIADLLVPAE